MTRQHAAMPFSGRTAEDYPSLFASMGRGLTPFAPSMPRIEGWARSLLDPTVAHEESDIPAGYTYFGQFLAHDMTFSPAFGLIENRRTPRLDLDSLYGAASGLESLTRPDLYETGDESRFLIGGKRDPYRVARRMLDVRRKFARGKLLDDDLPRAMNGRAIIADPRNDNNFIVSQVHLAFLKAHNALARTVEDRDAGERRAAARRDLRHRYEWCILGDYLPRLLDAARKKQLENLLDGKSVDLPLKDAARNGLPREFSFAAFRFGHAMVRSEYQLTRQLRPFALMPTTWPGIRGAHLSSASDIARGWTIDWSCFFDSARETTLRAQRAMAIGPRLATGMGNLDVPGESASLPILTLTRSLSMKLPSGQAVADALGLAAMAGEELPLWLYVLREAEEGRLGPVASTIVLSVIYAQIEADQGSFLHRPDRREWIKKMKAAGYGVYDLLMEGWLEEGDEAPAARPQPKAPARSPHSRGSSRGIRDGREKSAGSD